MTAPTFPKPDISQYARELLTPQPIRVTGDVSGDSVSYFNGSAPVDIDLTLSNTGVTAGTYGDSTHVAQVTVNAKGLVTGVTAVAITGGGSGTVTSVALSAPAMFSVTGSPVTTTGTLAFSLVNQNANLVFAGPSTGAAAAPTFRALVAADIPALGANPTATASDTAVNGTATTYMRSDAAPAVQKGSASQFGVVKVDGTTITSSSGVISAVGGGSGDLVKIATVTTSGGQTSIDFPSIPNSYSSLRLIGQLRGGSTDSVVLIQFNGDTNKANYTTTQLQGTSNAASSNTFATSNAVANLIFDMPNSSATANNTSPVEALIPNYAGTSFNKGWNAASGGPTNMKDAGGVWLSTAAINRVTLVTQNGQAFANGLVITLYGLK